MDSANDLIGKYCQRFAHLQYIDVNPALFDEVGKPILELFESDRVHLKPLAYKEFTKIIKPVLEDAQNKEAQNKT